MMHSRILVEYHIENELFSTEFCAFSSILFKRYWMIEHWTNILLQKNHSQQEFVQLSGSLFEDIVRHWPRIGDHTRYWIVLTKLVLKYSSDVKEIKLHRISMRYYNWIGSFSVILDSTIAIVSTKCCIVMCAQRITWKITYS